MITRGKRLGTRALALSLVSGVIVGVTGAAGENATTSQRVSVQSSAFVRPAATPLLSVPPRVGKTHGVGEGISQPVVITRPVAPGHDSVPPAAVSSGNGNAYGHDQGNGNGRGNGNGNDNGNGNGNGNGNDNGQGNDGTGSTGVSVPSPQSGPTGDPGQNGPTGDQGQNGPTGDQGQNGPTGDPGNHGRHRGDGQGNSGQGNPPVSVPVSIPVPTAPVPTPTSGGTVSHTPVTTTTPATTPAPATTPTVTNQTPAPKVSGNGFTVSGPVPVTAKKKTSHRSSNPLLAAANSGLSVPLSRVAAELARAAGASGLTAAGGTTATGSASTSGSSSASAASVVAQRAAAARAEAARKALARKRAEEANSNPITLALGPVTHWVKFIPSSIWIALAAAIGLALMGATAAVAAGRRARRQARRVAEVSAVALTDPLTGVLNRRGFIEAAERELDRAVRHGRPFALSYIDVRGLKGVNDGEGHLAGDQLLKAATAALTDSVRAHDVVGRLGGDEFGLLLAEQTTEEAAQVCERIADQVTATRAELGFAAHWDLTVGTASFPQDGSTIDELLAVADRRLYEQRGIELAAAR